MTPIPPAADPTLAEIVVSCVRVLLSNPRHHLKAAADEMHRQRPKDKTLDAEGLFRYTVDDTLSSLCMLCVQTTGGGDIFPQQTGPLAGTGVIFTAANTLDDILRIARRDDLLEAEAQFKAVPSLDDIESADAKSSAGQHFMNALFAGMACLCRAAVVRQDMLASEQSMNGATDGPQDNAPHDTVGVKP